MHLMFSEPGQPYEVLPAVEKAMDLFLILHADHEQNCSTSTVRVTVLDLICLAQYLQEWRIVGTVAWGS